MYTTSMLFQFHVYIIHIFLRKDCMNVKINEILSRLWLVVTKASTTAYNLYIVTVNVLLACLRLFLLELNSFVCYHGFTLSGVWSCWSAVSGCSVTCGRGMVIRYRECDSLPPGNKFIIPCEGNREETTDCDMGPCISKCYFHIHL
jgi:hypothetical protein